MRKFKTMMDKMAVNAMVAGAVAKEKVVGIFTANDGEGFVDTALVRHVFN